MPILSFRGRRELSTGLQLQQTDQNHMAISHYCQARSQVGQKAPYPSHFGLQILSRSIEQKLS